MSEGSLRCASYHAVLIEPVTLNSETPAASLAWIASCSRRGERFRIHLDPNLRGQVVPLRENQVLSKQLQHHALLAVKVTHEAERTGLLGLIHHYLGG